MAIVHVTAYTGSSRGVDLRVNGRQTLVPIGQDVVLDDFFFPALMDSSAVVQVITPPVEPEPTRKPRRKTPDPVEPEEKTT